MGAACEPVLPPVNQPDFFLRPGEGLMNVTVNRLRLVHSLPPSSAAWVWRGAGLGMLGLPIASGSQLLLNGSWCGSGWCTE
jgi:hypothetical protein